MHDTHDAAATPQHGHESESNGAVAKRPRFRQRLQRFEFELELEDGRIMECYLEETWGPELNEYKQFLSNKTRFKNGRPVGTKDHDGIVERLLAICLREVANPSRRFTEREINKLLPSSQQAELYKEALLLTGLADKEALEAAKND